MLRDDFDVIDERRDLAMIRIQNYHQATARYYKSKAKQMRFQVGDLVLPERYPKIPKNEVPKHKEPTVNGSTASPQ